MGGYEITTDVGRIDRAAVHRWLSEDSYWAKGRPRETMDRAIDGSLCFAALAPDGALAAFARVVSDRATFAWICDVFVLEPHRGQGLGVELVRTILEHSELASVRRWHLATEDAHGLYARFGFEPADPGRVLVMTRRVAG